MGSSNVDFLFMRWDYQRTGGPGNPYHQEGNVFVVYRKQCFVSASSTSELLIEINLFLKHGVGSEFWNSVLSYYFKLILGN